MFQDLPEKKNTAKLSASSTSSNIQIFLNIGVPNTFFGTGSCSQRFIHVFSADIKSQVMGGSNSGGEVMLKRSIIGECKVFVRAYPMKCSHSEVGEGLQLAVNITHEDLPCWNTCVFVQPHNCVNMSVLFFFKHNDS